MLRFMTTRAAFTLTPTPPASKLSPMENQNTPTPSGTSPGAASAGSAQDHNEALRILASCLSQAFEANREWRRFAADGQERADQEAELTELERAEAWLAALPERFLIIPAQEGGSK